MLSYLPPERMPPPRWPLLSAPRELCRLTSNDESALPVIKIRVELIDRGTQARLLAILFGYIASQMLPYRPIRFSTEAGDAELVPGIRSRSWLTTLRPSSNRSRRQNPYMKSSCSAEYGTFCRLRWRRCRTTYLCHRLRSVELR